MRQGTVFVSATVLPSEAFDVVECSKVYFGPDDMTDFCESMDALLAHDKDKKLEACHGGEYHIQAVANAVDSLTGVTADLAKGVAMENIVGLWGDLKTVRKYPYSSPDRSVWLDWSTLFFFGRHFSNVRL